MGKTLEILAAELPLGPLRKAAWKKNKQRYQEMVRHSELLFEQVKKSYECLEHHRGQVTIQRKEVMNRIRETKQRGRRCISQYHELQQNISASEEELLMLDEEEKELKETEHDMYLLQREEVSFQLVDITTELKFLKERMGRLVPIHESIKQKSYSAQQDYRFAENTFTELHDEVQRYTDNIRSGGPFHFFSLEHTLQHLSRKYAVIRLSPVNQTEVQKQNNPLSKDSIRAQLINEDYVSKCIEYIEQVQSDFTS